MVLTIIFTSMSYVALDLHLLEFFGFIEFFLIPDSEI